jgi:amino acid transporter
VKIKLVGASMFGLMLFLTSATRLLADDPKPHETSVFNLPDGMVGDLFAALCFGILAIALIVVGYKIFDIATPGIHFEHHVANGNLPAAIVFASMILGLCYVVAHVVAAIIGQPN